MNLNHPLAQPGVFSLALARSSSYFSLHDIENALHHYRVVYIDDDEKKLQKQIIMEFPAYTDLVALPALVAELKPYVLQGAIITALENLSLKNGVPVPF